MKGKREYNVEDYEIVNNIIEFYKSDLPAERKFDFIVSKPFLGRLYTLGIKFKIKPVEDFQEAIDCIYKRLLKTRIYEETYYHNKFKDHTKVKITDSVIGEIFKSYASREINSKEFIKRMAARHKELGTYDKLGLTDE